MYMVRGGDMLLPQHGYFIGEDDGFDYIRKLEQDRVDRLNIRGIMNVGKFFSLLAVLPHSSIVSPSSQLLEIT